MTIIAIDFETATSRRDSACAIGLAWIEAGEVTRREYRLIRPRELRFDPGNVRVHSITERDVRDQPTFPAVFREFVGAIDGALVLAHNASFDLSVLNACLQSYGLPRPALETSCTLALARRIWPAEPNHKLSSLANRFGLRFQHHHAGEDAYACAHIALEAVRAAKARDVHALARRYELVKSHAALPGLVQDGIAARALAALNTVLTPQPADASLFVVRGSRGTPYEIRLRMKPGRAAELLCSCVGARFRVECRHVKQLKAGNLADLLSDNRKDARKIAALFAA
ncbi:hypothetical protein Sa4125_31170 [Aureimonas sp. SA4125]|uniref:3'-5' exonuclease n=1 Tax=Aureimonas sp. SA4125 TaxID=2826993 RepID=UPI001CC5B0C7|nr:3'-5' exonuclease [Aureimonas sp. SA4125]BDA85575.1 hypothetical protein Sa4125_31170 [Aureimonas sp. SA4125]